MENILEVKDLHTYFYLEEKVSRAVEGVSFTLQKGETLALVGESGCGKTVTALSIMGLVPNPPGKIMGGEVNFQGQDLTRLKRQKMRAIRGQEIGMIFQEPMSALNPLYTIGYQIQEALLAHQNLSRQEAQQRVVQLLRQVEMPQAEQRYSDYPHNLSGGLRQRAMIAQGLAGNPKILIADEPTTALDVTIQAEILQLFAHLKEKLNMSVLLITHDLGIVAEVADRVCIMYAGKVVEVTDVFTIFEQPKHPYTQKLLDSRPGRGQARKRLAAIRGTVPDPADKPSGCAFHPRCDRAIARCQDEYPPFLPFDQGHQVSCWKAK
ncbi:ABC transporter ATP-binding protein [Candidatus Omnitrophota bacterium]